MRHIGSGAGGNPGLLAVAQRSVHMRSLGGGLARGKWGSSAHCTRAWVGNGDVTDTKLPSGSECPSHASEAAARAVDGTQGRAARDHQRHHVAIVDDTEALGHLWRGGEVEVDGGGPQMGEGKKNARCT